uniref:Brain expressed associated with NEDD4 1 n=1 Tax=Anolis carolinensis TaxID=28377 RepID=A0A803T4H9_ANOCA
MQNLIIVKGLIPVGASHQHAHKRYSSVLVAGVVIGLVLFLSCVAIIVGSLRKKRCFRHLQLQRDVSYSKTAVQSLLYVSVSKYQYNISNFCLGAGCSSPRSFTWPPPSWRDKAKNCMCFLCFSYDECVGPEATQIYIPTDDPPPYSLIDPCQQNGMTPSIAWRGGGGGGEMGPGTATEWDAGHLLSLQDLPQPIPSISLLSSSFPMEAAPPYETVVHEQTTTLPLAQLDLLKNSTDYYQTSSNRIS